MSEVGHNKNAANFKSLYQILEEMGTLYNPSNPAIALSAMQPRIAELDGVTEIFNVKNPAYKNAVAQRVTHIKPLSKLITRILNNFKASGASQPDIDNAKSLAKLIRGGSRRKVNPETASANTISTSRMSYDNRTANFETMIGFLESHSTYAPNEDEIKIVTLKSINTEQKSQNAAVNHAANELLTARTARNNTLYRETVGVVHLVPSVKSYLKSLGETGKPYYEAAVRLKFSKK